MTILKEEPPPGKLASGAVVYVDDGTCPKGRIKQVAAGNNVGFGSSTGSSKRSRKCVPYPK